MGGIVSAIVPIAAAIAVPAIAPAIAPIVGSTIVANVATGAVLGAATSAIRGGDPLRGALTGGVGSGVSSAFGSFFSGAGPSEAFAGGFEPDIGGGFDVLETVPFDAAVPSPGSTVFQSGAPLTARAAEALGIDPGITRAGGAGLTRFTGDVVGTLTSGGSLSQGLRRGALGGLGSVAGSAIRGVDLGLGSEGTEIAQRLGQPLADYGISQVFAPQRPAEYAGGQITSRQVPLEPTEAVEGGRPSLATRGVPDAGYAPGGAIFGSGARADERSQRPVWNIRSLRVRDEEESA